MSKKETKQLHIDDQLRRMGRRELIEVIYALQQNELEQAKRIKKLQAELDERALKMTNTGSIAEASLALSGIFDRAQEAADQYVQSVCASGSLAQNRADQIVEDARNTAHQLVANAGDRAQHMVNEAQAAAQVILADAQAKAARIQAEAEAAVREKLSPVDEQHFGEEAREQDDLAEETTPNADVFLSESVVEEDGEAENSQQRG